MEYSDLNYDEQMEVQNIIRIFDIPRLLTLNKIELGNVLCSLLNDIGQDGKKFVHHFYDVAPNHNPLAKLNPQKYALYSFVALVLKTGLKTYGRDINDGEGFFELASEIIEKMEIAEEL